MQHDVLLLPVLSLRSSDLRFSCFFFVKQLKRLFLNEKHCKRDISFLGATSARVNIIQVHITYNRYLNLLFFETEFIKRAIFVIQNKSF